MTIRLKIDVYPRKLWYNNSEKHNNFGPAIEYPSGSKEYWVNGSLHRIDGPAAEYLWGHKEYWVNDVEYSYLEYLVACEQLKTNKENI